MLGALGHPVIVGFEATGNYHRPLAWRLVEAGFGVRLISSVALSRTREALHNGWDKNDPKDAQVILHMLRIGLTQHYHDPLAEGLNDIQELSKTHEVVSKAKTEILHRIQTHYLPLYFPEVERFRNSTRSEWFFAFLDRFPTPASITALDKDAFVKAAWDVVGRKVSKARLLADIYETARSSIGLPIDPSSPAIAIVGEHDVEGVGNGRDEVTQELGGGHFPGFLDQLSEGELRGPVDGHEEVELALGGAQLGDVDVEVADRVALELLLGWLVARHLGQPRDAVALQAAMQGRAREVRDCRLQRVKTIVQRQQRVPAEGPDDRFLLTRQDRRVLRLRARRTFLD